MFRFMDISGYVLVQIDTFTFMLVLVFMAVLRLRFIIRHIIRHGVYLEWLC